MNVPSHIFRMYDIRGISGKELNEEFCYTLGNEFSKIIPNSYPKRVVIGRDCRLTSNSYASALIEGLRDGGIDIIDLGMVPTPLVYFALFRKKLGGGIVVTASHNPPEDNGFKLSLGQDSLKGDEIQALGKMIQNPSPIIKNHRGTLESEDISSEYIDFIKKNVSIVRPVSLVFDAGNGAASEISSLLFRELKLNSTSLFCEPDGNFPNHHPDPSDPGTLKHLLEKVRSISAEVGVAFDGDGDRIGVVDKHGRIYYGDELLILFARDVLSKNSGATIISEVKASERLFNEIIKCGGKPLMWKTGHSLIKSKMKETGALLAGEMSGHMFFADRYFGYDDAIYAAVRLTELLSKSQLTISEHLAGLPKSFLTPEIRIKCKEALKFRVVDSVKSHFKNIYPINDIDGVRISFKDGWGLVRASNTGPILVLRFEASDPERLQEIREEVEEVVLDASSG